MYSPLIGQFAERDPEGYAAGDENLYRYCDDAPLVRIDPSGERLTEIEVAMDRELTANPSKPDKPFKKITTEKVFVVSNARAKELHAALENFPDETFDELMKLGKVKWNGKPFPERYTRQHFLAWLLREEENTCYRQVNGTLKDLVEETKQVLNDNNHSYDFTVVEVHGEFVKKDGKSIPTGTVAFHGGSINQQVVVDTLRKIANPFKSTYQPVSCFANKGKKAEETTLYPAEASTSENLFKYPNDDDQRRRYIPLSSSSKKCEIWFTPMKATFRQVDADAQSNRPVRARRNL